MGQLWLLTEIDCNALMLFSAICIAREAGCFREVAALNSDHRQVRCDVIDLAFSLSSLLSHNAALPYSISFLC